MHICRAQNTTPFVAGLVFATHCLSLLCCIDAAIKRMVKIPRNVENIDSFVALSTIFYCNTSCDLVVSTKSEGKDSSYSN